MPAGLNLNPGIFGQTDARERVLGRVRAQVEAFEKLLQK